MGILHFSQFSSSFYGIQWETCNFLLLCKFSMLFNGKFVFFSISHVIQWEFEAWETLGGGTYGRTDVRTSGNSPLCPTGHRPFGAAAQKGNPLVLTFLRLNFCLINFDLFLNKKKTKKTTFKKFISWTFKLLLFSANPSNIIWVISCKKEKKNGWKFEKNCWGIFFL